MGLPKIKADNFKTKTSVDDYLESEEFSPVKREFVYGEVYAMAGTSDNHNPIAGDVYALLLFHLRGSKCQPFFADVKVQVNPNVYYYPDIFVSCEENVEDPNIRQKPILVVEVTSDSTRKIDRREKMAFYLQMPSVQEYVIVEQKKRLIEIHRRQANGSWLTHFYSSPDEEFEFTSVDLPLTVGDVYRRVTFSTSK